ncbi:hypothetical protein [Paenibacillus eucommiae]|uniref:Uncharacterized protein n=1 Tax=Paenibacillus eucommiae TaxID=1355755 RepID=A0ABS4J5W2_9BACL|nr:hypothetical protein [Paenibacillus eucommiae]MBP1995207.1 hypothetical protein [Paenibacillus eucommiae]
MTVVIAFVIFDDDYNGKNARKTVTKIEENHSELLKSTPQSEVRADNTTSTSSSTSASISTIYKYMMDEFDQITNYGDNYDPEIHDLQVLKRASEHFNISISEADKIYLEMATSGF